SNGPIQSTRPDIAQNPQIIAAKEYAAEPTRAGIFWEIRHHARLTANRRAATALREAKADSLISLGGASPIDSTKIIVKHLSEDSQHPAIPHTAVPTTLSAAEFSHVAGMTDEKLNRKTGFRHLRMVPRSIFLDPELTIPTPGWLWASSGFRCLDLAVEAVYSQNSQSYVNTLAVVD